MKKKTIKKNITKTDTKRRKEQIGRNNANFCFNKG